MSRIIQPDSSGKTRNKLCKQILVCVRELMKQSEITEESKDLAAFIVLALREVYAGIDPSVEAWEKRGYWVKADRFRMDWEWSGRIASQLDQALKDDDWSALPPIIIQVAGKLSNVTPASRNANGKFWDGAFYRLVSAN